MCEHDACRFLGQCRRLCFATTGRMWLGGGTGGAQRAPRHPDTACHSMLSGRLQTTALTDVHGKTDIGGAQRRRVVGAVPCHRHHILCQAAHACKENVGLHTSLVPAVEQRGRVQGSCAAQHNLCLKLATAMLCRQSQTVHCAMCPAKPAQHRRSKPSMPTRHNGVLVSGCAARQHSQAGPQPQEFGCAAVGRFGLCVGGMVGWVAAS